MYSVYFKKGGLGSNIGHGLFVGWVVHPDIFCWVSFLNPTYLMAIFVLSTKPNKMSEDRTIPKKDFAKRFHPSSFDIRYSAVRCLIQAIEAASLIIKKPCHFGVVSYEVLASGNFFLIFNSLYGDILDLCRFPINTNTEYPVPPK